MLAWQLYSNPTSGKVMADNNNDSFIRWQQISREHLSSVTNLIMALATGLLAFQSSVLLDYKFTLSLSHNLAISSLIFLAICVSLSLWCSVNRLRDFRLTTKIAIERDKQHFSIAEFRKKTSLLGALTWKLFWLQLVFFGLGAATSAISVIFQVFDCT